MEAARKKQEANAAAAQAAENARTAAEAEAARKKQEEANRAAANAAAAQAAANKAAENARTAAEADAARKKQEEANRAAANALKAAKAAATAKARGALRRAVLLSRVVAAPSGSARRAALMGTAASNLQKKTFENFLKNFSISGAAPRNVLARTTKETSKNNSWKFLSKSMLVPYKGSTYPNKINWPLAVQKLNDYNLTNSQKNMIRRVNIAVAAQPKKGRFEKRRPVRVDISGLSRDQAIQKHKDAMKRENNVKRNEEERANRERRAARASRPSGGTTAPTTSRPSVYNMMGLN